MNKSKAISLLIIAPLTIGVLTACNSSEDDTSASTITSTSTTSAKESDDEKTSETTSPDNKDKETKITMGEQKEPDFLDDFGALKIANTNLKDDVVRVDIVFDFSCPACQMVDSLLKDKLKEQVDNGEITLHLNPISFLDSATKKDYSSRAASAFMTIAEESPEKAFDFMSLLFSEKYFNADGKESKEVGDEYFVEIAKEVGTSEKTQEAIKENHYYEWAKKNTEKVALDSTLYSKEERLSTPRIRFGRDTEKPGTARLSGAVEEDYLMYLDMYKNPDKTFNILGE